MVNTFLKLGGNYKSVLQTSVRKMRISQSICPGGNFKIAGIAMGVCLLLLDTIAVVRSNSSPRIWEESG